ncbi:MAG: pyridoxal-phosphate dependent enzyme [Bacteroidales bacterium]|nr:pyridoxal-phosphate dependent enzyme [Bacteroidales bacterium]MCF8456895.1 pyridoxal-phosphate dependent enzyme [Bacteroidales bacterium]
MTKPISKYHLRCRECDTIIESMNAWFTHFQKCPSCGNKWVDVEYSRDNLDIKKLIESETKPASVFHYFDFLPLDDRKNIVTRGEGTIPVQRWTIFEDFAREHYGLNLKVSVYRNDINDGTNTFKDVAASVAASVLKENGVTQYAVASTGNIASAFAHYLAEAGISLAVFIPNDALRANEAEISSYGQRVFRVNGDYALAKKIAAEYSEKYKILLSGGNVDPMRVEAKKTMVWEWLRQTGELPDVYVQALSGGTGPIAIDKGIREIKGLGYPEKLPRFIMVQPSGCDPMTAGWKKAKAAGFPEGWKKDYPIYDNPITLIPTLATGNPATFPIIADLVHKSKGEIITFNEHKCLEVAHLIAYEKGVKIGPASTIAVGGFFEALKQGIFKEGESVLINIGESMNRAPEFVDGMIYTTKYVDTIDDCTPPNREEYREKLWAKFK